METNLSEKTVKELKDLAAQHNIDLSGQRKKADIISTIENNLSLNNKGEVLEMENENVNVNVNEDEKVEGANETPETETETVEDTKAFHLDDGSECSRSAYIRQEFEKDRSRKDIAKELGVKYYIVYSATANMHNAVHAEGESGAGRSGVMVAKVNTDFEFVNEAGEVVEDEAEAVQVSRADVMRELFSAGITRGKIKDYFEVPYATVYAATKDTEAPAGTVRGGKKTIVHPETGEEVNRVDYIRELYAGGMSRKDIAKKLTDLSDELVDYATVWAATKPEKDEDKEVEVEVEAEATEAVETEEDNKQEDQDNEVDEDTDSVYED